MSTYEYLVKEFLSHGKCNIAQYVRNLIVKDDLPANDLMLILDKIRKLGILKRLRRVMQKRTSASLVTLTLIVGKQPLMYHHLCLTSHTILRRSSSHMFRCVTAGRQKLLMSDTWMTGFSLSSFFFEKLYFRHHLSGLAGECPCNLGVRKANTSHIRGW